MVIEETRLGVSSVENDTARFTQSMSEARALAPKYLFGFRARLHAHLHQHSRMILGRVSVTPTE
jgi:hypothetical protein